MSESSRRKTYYRKRLLIEAARVLVPQQDDSLLCITGAQLEMLRNLMPYLRRQSTFVSSYAVGYYLAPFGDDWDDIQAIVDDLEETLMGCDTITAALEDIAAQLACLCLASGQRPTYSPCTGEMVDHFVTAGQATYEDPYPATTVADGDRCAVAQLVWQGAWEWLTEVVQPAQDWASDLMIPAVMVIIALWVGPAVFAIPTGALLAAVWATIEIWEDGEFENVRNALLSIKEEIVCAVYQGLLIDAKTASGNAQDVIYAQSLPLGDKICLSLLCAPWMIAACDLAWDEPTAWATANVTPGYCDVCAELEEGVEFTWTWPPCPATHHTDGGVCDEDPLKLCFNGDVDDAHQQHVATAGTYNEVELEIRFKSKFGTGWTVGAIEIETWDTGLEEWVWVATMSANTSQPIGTLNICLDQFAQDPVIDGGLYRTVLKGAAGQHDSDPYPMQLGYARVKYSTV